MRNAEAPIIKNDNTHKNGIQVRFSNNADGRLRASMRYSRRVKPTFPRIGKTKVHANQTSNECR
jgi:hypothetical protein